MDVTSRPDGTATAHSYVAERLTYDSVHDFGTTRARFEEQVPVFDIAVALDLIRSAASWDKVVAAVEARVGPTGLAAMARLDQGALLSLRDEPIEATLYLVGNPVLAREVIGAQRCATLYAPFRVAVYGDASGAHVTYDQPSSVFASVGSSIVDTIAVQLDDKIRTAAEEACR